MTSISLDGWFGVYALAAVVYKVAFTSSSLVTLREMGARAAVAGRPSDEYTQDLRENGAWAPLTRRTPQHPG